MFAAGFSAGAGMWSTHFIGMLGYDPGIAIAYDLKLTLVSLLVGILGSMAALTLSRWCAIPVVAVGAAVILGMSMTGMHLAGMASIRFAVVQSMNLPLLVTALLVGWSLTAIAFVIFARDTLRYATAVAAMLLTVSIAGVHFIAMGAAELVPNMAAPDTASSLPHFALAAGIAAIMLTIVGFAALALFVDRMRRANHALRESEAAYRLLAENTTDVIIWSDLDRTRRYVSPASMAVLGYRPEDIIGTRPLDFIHPDDVADLEQVLADLVAGRIEGAITTQRHRRRDGSWVWIEACLKVTRLPGSSEPIGYVSSLRDVTDRKAAETALRSSEERLAFALDSGSDGLWDWNIPTGNIWFSDRWQTMLGYEPGEIDGHMRALQQLMHPDDAATARRLLSDHIDGRTPVFECELRMRTKAGAYGWVLSRGKVVTRDAEGIPLRIVGTHIDIGRRKHAEQQLEHLALHDALTGLPNRVLFRDRLGREMDNVERRGHIFAVLACDLDRFKAINDSLGHPTGDSLLRQVAERLTANVHEGDTVARLGGDEFAIVLRGLDQPQNASAAAQQVIEALKRPFDLDGRSVSVGVSIGIAVGPQDGGDPDQLLKNADIALGRAKAAGRGTFRFCEPAMDAAIAERNVLELDMREAVRLGEFELHYQPIIDLATDTASGFEALMRWHHPVRGIVSPADFIPLAEETGLVVPLGTWALQEACREAAAWPGDLRVAVNVSAVQFAEPGLEHCVISALAASGLPPNRLELEITESVLIGDVESVTACLHRLRAFGVRIALDDFGTGYSSLSYLRRFPFDKIKIDRSFIREIADADTAAIVRAIVGLGERLGASITAEGIEDEAQLTRVRREGCTEAQGYLLSEPLPAADAYKFAFAKKNVAAA
ncbi:bifunctional diguanylate cyclase/phosphodiesterase [Methylobacterium bullatum]|uniref:bifunctional diguanylate cyclase/phosphodiesterase n=1 Tax=Methylobacterium bullatum TaxID=570505 RepID=UPI0030D5DFBF